MNETYSTGNSWIRSERARLGTSRNAVVRFNATDGSVDARPLVNAGLLALSMLQGDVRRHLVGTWMQSKGGAAAVYSAVNNSLIDFIAESLPDNSPELALCRVEQLVLRALCYPPDYEGPDPVFLTSLRVVRRGTRAGLVRFPVGCEALVSKLLRLERPPVCAGNCVSLLVAPGSKPLYRLASPEEYVLWSALTHPTCVGELLKAGIESGAIAVLLKIGALEYA